MSNKDIIYAVLAIVGMFITWYLTRREKNSVINKTDAETYKTDVEAADKKVDIGIKVNEYNVKELDRMKDENTNLRNVLNKTNDRLEKVETELHSLREELRKAGVIIEQQKAKITMYETISKK